jgi:hypothetical protein
LFLISFVLLIPIINAKEEVYIESISIEDSSTLVEERSTPAYDGLKVKFDVGFKNINDFIIYKIVINNNSAIDYELDINTFNTSKVTNMQSMLSLLTNCQRILVGNDWDTSNVVYSSSMFYESRLLRNYNSNILDKTKAHTAEDGYLTLKSS